MKHTRHAFSLASLLLVLMPSVVIRAEAETDTGQPAVSPVPGGVAWAPQPAIPYPWYPPQAYPAMRPMPMAPSGQWLMPPSGYAPPPGYPAMVVPAQQAAEADHNAERERLLAELAGKQTELEHRLQQLEQARASLQTALKQVQTAQAGLSDEQARASALQAQLLTASSERDRATAQVSELTDKLATLKQSLSQQDEKLAAMQKGNDTLRSEIERLRQALASRDKDLAALKKVVADRDEQLSALHKDLAERDSQLAQASTDAASRNSKLAKLQAGIDNPDKKLAELQAQVNVSLASTREALKHLQNQIAAIATAPAAAETAMPETASGKQQAQAVGPDDDQSASSEAADEAGPAPAAGIATPQAPLTDRSAESKAAPEDAAERQGGVGTGAEDSDGDGVKDSTDLCPDTASGATVEVTGCVTGQVMVLEGVKFRDDSHELTDSARAVLDRLAGVLRAHPELKLEVGGHSDAQGDEANNQRLSEQRAKSVREYLVEQGLNPGNIVARGYGSTQPIAADNTRSDLRQNDRVELRRLQ